MKPCLQQEKELLLSAVGKEDQLFFLHGEEELLAHPEKDRIDVVFGEPVMATISAMGGLRWIQMTWAGANKYISQACFPPDVTVTNASGAFGKVISEHILAGVLSLYKNLRAYQTQLQEGAWQLLAGDDTLEGKRALILGTGNIGRETAKKLQAFGTYNVGISRTGQETPEGFDACYGADALDMQLPKADLVIVALPGTAQTKGLFSRQRIGKLKAGAVFVNVGRGMIVDTEALTCALEQGGLRGAVLDVTDPEPLPVDHRLRFLDNVILTPHVSGICWGENTYTRKRILEIFCENLKRDREGVPFKNQIDFSRGY